MTKKVMFGLFIISSLWLLVHTETLILQGIRTKWILKDKLFGKGQAGRVFLGEELINSNKWWFRQVGPGGPVAIKITIKTNYDNEVKLSRKKRKDLSTPQLYDYNEVADHIGKAFASGVKFYFLVFEIVGKSLEKIHKMLGSPMSPRTIATIGKTYINMMHDMHFNMKICHRDFVEMNLTVGFNDSRKFYVIDFGRLSESKEDNSRFFDVSELVKTLLLLTLQPDATTSSPEIFGGHWQNVQVDTMKDELRNNTLFNGSPEELKKLAIFCVEKRDEWRNNYHKLIQFMDEILANPQYGTEDKLDWEGMPNINTSLDSLETLTMKPIGDPPMFNTLLSYIIRFMNAIRSIPIRDMLGINS